jgi:hypothetical protein
LKLKKKGEEYQKSACFPQFSENKFLEIKYPFQILAGKNKSSNSRSQNPEWEIKVITTQQLMCTV